MNIKRDIVEHKYERVYIPLEKLAEIAEMPAEELWDRVFNTSFNWADKVLIMELRVKT